MSRTARCQQLQTQTTYPLWHNQVNMVGTGMCSSGAGCQNWDPGDDREAEEPLENQDRDPEHELACGMGGGWCSRAKCTTRNDFLDIAIHPWLYSHSELPPDVYMADLMAGERAAFTKARKKRVSALQSVGELLAAQPREEHREARREDRRNFQEFLTEMRTARQEDQDAHAMMLAAMERSLNSTDELTRIVSLLVQAQVAHLAMSQARNQDLRAEAAQGVPSGRSAYGTDSGIQWHMPPQPPLTFPPYTGAGAQALHPLEPQCRVIPMQPPDTQKQAVQAPSSLCPPLHILHTGKTVHWNPGSQAHRQLK
ncbi:UNVERIFIED_CONTAM: hypothetical protein K2H54_048203 [Gekko kuhli]